MTTHLFVASTYFELLSLAAADEAGALPTDGERVLMLASGAQVPEVARPLDEWEGFDTLTRRYDRVLDLAELVYPLRPAQFGFRPETVHMMEKLLREHWRLDDRDLHLWLDTVAVPPCLSLATLFSDATLHLHADGLMMYGPTRNALPVSLRQRLLSITHLDMVPGLRPQMALEAAPELVAVPMESLFGVVAGLTDESAAHHSGETPTTLGEDTALVLGQYLSGLQVVTPQEELTLHGHMVERARERGFERVVFRPHPAASASATEMLREQSEARGVRVEIDRSPEPAEFAMVRRQPGLVVSCFSTGLVTARALGVAAEAVGTRSVLERLPYPNSNRVPLVLADALFAQGLPTPADAADAADDAADAAAGPAPTRDVAGLVRAVAYTQQPDILTDIRPEVVAWLESVADDRDFVSRYFKRFRLTELDLPGGGPLDPNALGHRVRSTLRNAAPESLRPIATGVWHRWQSLGSPRRDTSEEIRP